MIKGIMTLGLLINIAKYSWLGQLTNVTRIPFSWGKSFE